MLDETYRTFSMSIPQIGSHGPPGYFVSEPSTLWLSPSFHRLCCCCPCSGWTAVWDKAYSTYYYHNVFTDETTWVLPSDKAATETIPTNSVEQAPRQNASPPSSPLSNGVEASTDAVDPQASEEAGEDRRKEEKMSSRASKRQQSSVPGQAVDERAEASLESMSGTGGNKKADELEETSTGEEAASAASATAPAKDEGLAEKEKEAGASKEGASLSADELPRYGIASFGLFFFFAKLLQQAIVRKSMSSLARSGYGSSHVFGRNAIRWPLRKCRGHSTVALRIDFVVFPLYFLLPWGVHGICYACLLSLHSAIVRHSRKSFSGSRKAVWRITPRRWIRETFRGFVCAEFKKATKLCWFPAEEGYARVSTEGWKANIALGATVGRKLHLAPGVF